MRFLVGLAVVLWIPMLTASAEAQVPPLEPAKVTGAESCGECHASTFEVWRKTTHATGFKTLHRRESAEAISERLGVRLIKRGSICIDCHYTPTERDAEVRALSGVSCESCHGAGRDWIEVHNDYGGRGIDHRSETAEHRAQRLAASEAAGMRRGSDLYAVASSCFGCHTVPREELVNVGKHSLGSADFELAEWISGEIRHNFLESFLDGDGTVNAERPPEHRRRVYVLGRALALEHSLRGVAEATEQGVYLRAMLGRLRSALSEIRTIARLGEFPEIEELLTTAREVRAGLGKREALLAAADRVAELIQAFLARHDGTQLAMLDPLVEGRLEEIADLLDDAEDAEVDADPIDDGSDEDPTTAVADSSASGAAVGVSPASTGTDSPAASAPTSPAVAAVAAEGDKRSHLRPRSSHDTLEATACQKCHGDQHAWWYADRHSTSIERFLDEDPAAIKIARLYGLSPSRITRGDSLCMDCHGTTATARARREVLDGVSCQSCHGPAADYFEPHQEGDKALGRQRPGYVRALELGMNDLRDFETKLRNCASCHYVTDPRLISSGHPTGVDFDIAAALPEVRHWEPAVEDAATLSAGWSAVLAERGPVPQVRRARLAEAAGNSAPAAAVGGASVGGGRQAPTVLPPRPVRRDRGSAAVGSATGRPADRSVGSSAPSDVGSLDLPGLDLPGLDPVVTEGLESGSVEDVLLFLKDQLEALYRASPPRPTPRRPAPPANTTPPSQPSNPTDSEGPR